MIPLCDLCGNRHHGYQGHVFATNAVATNNELRRGKDAGRQAAGESPDVSGGAIVAERVLESSARTANRRSREAYNAYQREYMRKRRLSKNKN